MSKTAFMVCNLLRFYCRWRVFLGYLLLLAVRPADGWTLDGWPQWGGPSRDFHVARGPVDWNWDSGQPHQLWQRDLGDGYAGIAIAEQILYAMFRRDDLEQVTAINSQTGEVIWTHSYPAPPHNGTDLSPGPGPHATPAVVGSQIFTAGVTGILHALDRTSGEVIWRHRVIDDLGGTLNFRGYSQSPLPYKDKILMNVGGTGQAVMAFDQKTGKVCWKSQDYQISHVSPRMIDVAGQQQLVSIADGFVFALDPDDGDLLWKFEHGIDGGSICSSPAWDGKEHLFFSAAYGRGSWVLHLTGDSESTEVQPLWHHQRLRVHHSNIIVKDGSIFAPHGDFGTIVFSCVDLVTGEVLWRTREIGRASQLLVDGRHLVLDEEGKLMVVSLNREAPEIHHSMQLPEGQYWTPPSLVDGVLYLRNRRQIMAYRLVP
jgi:outer membrane protein assembly factor BamB